MDDASNLILNPFWILWQSHSPWKVTGRCVKPIFPGLAYHQLK